MTYQEQLQQPEWNSKRLEILERDDFKCKKCGVQPKLNGLVKSFGINSLDELRAKGYSLVGAIDSTLTYDNIAIIKDKYINTVKFIGDRDRDFDIQQLRFGLQCWSADTVFGKMQDYQTLSFYPEMLNAKNLIGLNIHHRYYIEGNKAWDYKNSALITLCVDCHKSEHEQNNICVYDRKWNKLDLAETCSKCCGAGYIEEYHYYMNGVCFDCLGQGVINTGIESRSSETHL